jgi:hypothetical protein
LTKEENLRKESLNELKERIKTQFGDFFEISCIFTLNELPKRLKSTGEIGIDKIVLNELIEKSNWV